MYNKKNVIIVVIVFLLVFSISSAYGLYRGVIGTTGTINSAVWNVAITPGANTTFRIMPDSGLAQYSFDVISNSEVDAKYSITVNNIPSGVEVKLDQGLFQGGNSTVTFPNVGTILYGGTNTNAHILTFRATTGATIVNNQSIGVFVTFEQII